MNNYPIREDTFMVYGLYPRNPADLQMILWYLHPYADKYLTQEKVLLTKEGVVIYQQGYQLRITLPSDVTTGVPSSIILPRLQDNSIKGPWTSEEEKVTSRLWTPRPDSEGPTRIWIPASESIDGQFSTVIKCLTEDNRASYAINIAKALYYLSQKVAIQLDSVTETNIINFNH